MSDHPPRPRRPVQQTDPDDIGSVWTFVWILVAFKVITIGLIFYHLRTFENGLFLGAMTWYWFVVIGAMVAGPLIFRYRLLRVRSRRQQLQRAEWMVQDEPITIP